MLAASTTSLGIAFTCPLMYYGHWWLYANASYMPIGAEMVREYCLPEMSSKEQTSFRIRKE